MNNRLSTYIVDPPFDRRAKVEDLMAANYQSFEEPENRKCRYRLGDASQAGFTLVEMLVVLVIVGLLVSLVAPRVFNQLAEAKVRTAHIQIESFKNALDLFYLDAGRYPTSEEGLTALTVKPSNVQSWGGPYSTTGERGGANQIASW